MRVWAGIACILLLFAAAACNASANVKGFQTQADSAGVTGTPADRLGICHQTGGPGSPWVYETIDSGAIAVHQAQGDVLGVHSQADCDALAQDGTPVGIPTVTPLAVTATETPAGQTATAVPTANNISVPAATMTAGKVGICHRTGSNKNPYVYLVVSASAVPAHRKHGDIIGVASARDCPAHAVPGNPGNDKGDEDNGNQGNDHGGDNGDGHGNGHGHEHGD